MNGIETAMERLKGLDPLGIPIRKTMCDMQPDFYLARAIRFLRDRFLEVVELIRGLETRADGQETYSKSIDYRLARVEERLAKEDAHAKTAVEALERVEAINNRLARLEEKHGREDCLNKAMAALERVEALGAKVEAINERVSGLECQMEEFDPNGEDLDGAEPVFNVPGSACAFEALKRCAERTGFRILKAESIHGIYIQCQCPKDSEAVTEPKIAPAADNVVPLRPDLGTYDLKVSIPVGPGALSIIEAQAQSDGFNSPEEWIHKHVKRSLAQMVMAVRANREAAKREGRP